MLYPLDSRFLDAEDGTPFERCMVCDKSVITSGEDYFIERIFRRLPENEGATEALFEYAMCARCADDLRKKLSEASKVSIEQLFTDRLNSKQMLGIEESTKYCLLTGKPIDQALEFSYHAHCNRDRLIHSFFPYAISDDGMDEIGALLSDETLGFLDDFKGRHFSGPPELADFLNPKRLIPL